MTTMMAMAKSCNALERNNIKIPPKKTEMEQNTHKKIKKTPYALKQKKSKMTCQMECPAHMWWKLKMEIKHTNTSFISSQLDVEEKKKRIQ